MNFVNLTKHTINIFDENKKQIFAIQSSGLEARIKTDFQNCGNFTTIDNKLVPIYRTVVIGTPYIIDGNENEHPMPETKSNTIYIVSGTFRQHFDRSDLWQPGKLLRNSAGQPIGCIGLSR